MIRIGISYSKFATSRSGGARESLLTLLNGVAREQDFAADVYQTPPADDLPETAFHYQLYTNRLYSIPKLTWANQVINRWQWSDYLRQQLTLELDLLITQNELAPASVEIANKLNIPSLFFVRSMALTGYEKYDPDHSHVTNILKTDFGGRIQYPFLEKNFHEYEQAAAKATYTIANSKFTAAKIKELFGVDSTVIYPPIALENYRVEYDREGYITMVNPRAEYKGADIFLDIAEELPDEEFLLVGTIASESIEERAETIPNVSHWEWCEDMREAYEMAKLIIVPSRWEEPFGRVPAEAMVSGIPCVVSNRGGLPEVVGNTGEIVDEIDSTQQWINAIEKSLLNHDPHAQKQRVERFSAEAQTEKLLQIINKAIDL